MDISGYILNHVILCEYTKGVKDDFPINRASESESLPLLLQSDMSRNVDKSLVMMKRNIRE